MRSVILVLATIGLLGGAFLLYSLLQTPPPAMDSLSRQPAKEVVRPQVQRPVANDATPPTGGPASPAPAPAGETTDRIIGAGENVWVKSFDKSNRLANEFRAAKYDPKGDIVSVLRPEARIYLEDGAVLLIQAAHGQVVIPDSSGQRETMRDARAQAPTRGELFDVTLSLLKSIDATDPILRCTMNNIVFDNDTFRIATETYTDAAGQTVPAERVPVTIRGQDYDFDGYGLVIRWNEVDQRLQLLEIACGDRLVVKNPDALRLDRISQAADAPGQAAPAAPIVITWAGPLRVVPGRTSRTLERQNYRAMLTEQVRVTQQDQELARADVLEIAFSVEPEDKPTEGRERPVVVSLTGAPTVVTVQGMQARAAVVSFDTATGSATLKASPEFPQIGLQDGKGRTMLAREVQYDPERAMATLLGPAKFEIALPPDESDKQTPRVLVADASKLCVIGFDPTSREPVLRSASLAGDVAVDHPQLKLNSQSLDLAFGPPGAGGEPTFDQLSAGGAVRASIVGDDGKLQKIACESLKLKARPGAAALAAESLSAAGDVRIDSAQQTVRAEKLDVTFAPQVDGGEKSILAIGEDRVASLLAEGAVSFVSPDGGGVWADRITLTKTAEGQDMLRVEGTPARIGDARGMLLATSIEFDPASGDARATGGGEFQTAFAGASDEPARPAVVAWAGDLNFDSARNMAQVNDGVTIRSDQPDGTRVSGSAAKLLLAFEPMSTTEPSATPLAGRRVADVSLNGNVQFAAVQADAGGALQQRVSLFSEKLVYQPVDGLIVVPVGGRMLAEDRRPPEEQPRSEALASSRGATAFQWSEKLSFSPAVRRAEMAGEVLVVHQPADDSSPELRLNADIVTADLASTASAGSPQVSRVSARGNVRFNSTGLEFSAAETEFRPQDDIVIARGDDTSPAMLLDEQGMSKGSFSELWLNTKTQESHVRDFRATVRR